MRAEIGILGDRNSKYLGEDSPLPIPCNPPPAPQVAASHLGDRRWLRTAWSWTIGSIFEGGFVLLHYPSNLQLEFGAWISHQMCSLCIPLVLPIHEEREVWACWLSLWFLSLGTQAGV